MSKYNNIYINPNNKNEGIIYSKIPEIIKKIYGNNKLGVLGTNFLGRLETNFKIKFNRDIYCKLNKKSKNKILHIKTIKDYNLFNEQYGYIYNNRSIRIKWKKVKKDYGGIYIDTKNLDWVDYWWQPIFKNKKYHSYFDGFDYPFIYIDNTIVIWNPKNIIKYAYQTQNLF